MAPVKDLLVNSLNDLAEEELKKFQWHLVNDHECVSKSDMEKADILDTVDKMVERFGQEEAVKNTVDTLRKMNQNNLAEQLENNHKQAPAEGRIEDPALVGASSEPTKDRAWNKHIQEKGSQLRLLPESRGLPSSLGRTGLMESGESMLRNAEELFRNHDRAWNMLIQEKGSHLGLLPESRVFPSSLGRTGLMESGASVSRNAEELFRNHDREWNMLLQEKGSQLGLLPESRVFPSSLGRTGLMESGVSVSRNAEELFRNHDRAWNMLIQENGLLPESRGLSSSLGRTGLLESGASGLRNAEELLRNHNSRQLTLDLNAAHTRIGPSEGNTVITHTYTTQSYPEHSFSSTNRRWCS